MAVAFGGITTRNDNVDPVRVQSLRACPLPVSETFRTVGESTAESRRTPLMVSAPAVGWPVGAEDAHAAGGVFDDARRYIRVRVRDTVSMKSVASRAWACDRRKLGHVVVVRSGGRVRRVNRC